MANHIAVFQETTIRRTWHNEEWWFSLSDVIVVLTDSADPKQYIKKMRSRDEALDVNWAITCTPVALTAPDGKQRETNCANTEGLFRIIHFIPLPKAEPFKRWLAQVGYERVKEIENPELASAQVPGFLKSRRVCKRKLHVTKIMYFQCNFRLQPNKYMRKQLLKT
jgi:DNA-damage-inducible protein D